MRGLLVAVATATLLLVGAGAASASSQCGDCTASYSGTWTVTWPFGTSGNAMVTLNFAESLQSGNWSLTSASGSYAEPAQPDNHYPGCNATLSMNASTAAMLGSFGPNVITRRSGYWTAELLPPTYWGVQGDPVNSSQTTGDCATSARVDYAGLSHSLGGAQCHFDPSAGNTEAIDFPVGSSYTVPDNCTGTITSNGVVYSVTLQSSVTFTSPGVVSPGSTVSWPPTPPSIAPPKPNKSKLQSDFVFTQKVATLVCADASEVGWESARDPAYRTMSVGLNFECDKWMARLQAIYDAFVADPPDSRYTQIALPAPWRAPLPSGSVCPHRAASGVCARLTRAFRIYETAGERAAEIWEALAETANRWGSAYAAFADDPSAPRGLALQAALSKAYYGELGVALSREASAGRRLSSALRRDGIGRTTVSATQRAGAQRLLNRSQPPRWVISRLVSDGVVSSAASLRASWHALLIRATVPASIDLASPFSVVSTVPQVPGETFRSMTVDDLYWIATAIPHAHARAVLLADLKAAFNAKSKPKRRVALKQFLADSQHHARGELSTLLRTSVGPLLR